VRLARAAALARHPRIKVSDLEARLGTHFTADTVSALKRRFPRHKFVWLMGADNLRQIAGWQRWPRIFTQLSIAVFDRPSYAFKALAGRAASRFRHHRVRPRQAGRLAELGPPAWVFLHIPLHKASATAIRAARGKPRAETRKGGRNHSTTPKKAVHSR